MGFHQHWIWSLRRFLRSLLTGKTWCKDVGKYQKYFSNIEAQGYLKKAQKSCNSRNITLLSPKEKKRLSTLNMLERISEQHEAIGLVLIEFNVGLLSEQKENDRLTLSTALDLRC